MWEIEDIPDQDLVYYRVHKIYLSNGKPNLGAFREIGEAMSVDWCKYSTPAESVSRAKIPEDNGIVSFVVKDLRTMRLLVEHSPSKNNRSHSDVKGIEKPIQNDPEIRFKLRKLAKWEVQIK
jgi:hypothetical protein